MYSNTMYSLIVLESERVDENGCDEHRVQREVLQRQNHLRLLQKHLGGPAELWQDDAVLNLIGQLGNY